MLKQIPERITYAQQKIINLIEERKLKQWCDSNGLSHSAIYRIGIGEQIPTYKTLCSMVHLISPVEWLFYTDEQLPYEPKIVPQWNPKEKCKFIKEHQYDYKEIAKKYGLNEISAYNICVAGRAAPSLALIRECCKDTNPIDFFIDGEEPEIINKFSPDRGDIVNIQGNIVVVLSNKNHAEHTQYLTCCPIKKDFKEGSKLSDTKTTGYIDINNIQTFKLSARCQPSFIETISEHTLSEILQEVRKIFE